MFLFLLLLCGGSVGTGYAVFYTNFFQVQRFTITEEGDATGYVFPREAFTRDLYDSLVEQSFFNRLLARAGDNSIFLWRAIPDSFLVQYPEFAGLALATDYFGREVTVSVARRERFGIICEKTQIGPVNPPAGRHGAGADGTQTQMSADLGTQINADKNSLASPTPAGTRCFWFDKAGMLFAEAPATDGGLIYKIDDFSGRTLSLGSSLFPHESFTTNVVGIFEVLRSANLPMRTLEVHALENQEVTAVQRGLPPVYFSLRNDPYFAVTPLRTLATAGLSKLAYIDVRIPNRIFYKLKNN